jgi:hypothetical protein
MALPSGTLAAIYFLILALTNVSINRGRQVLGRDSQAKFHEYRYK